MRQSARPPLSALRGAVATEYAARLAGHVGAVSALSVEITGLANQLAVGDRIILQARNGTLLPAEIIASRGNRLQAAPFGATLGIGTCAPALAPAGRADLRGALA